MSRDRAATRGESVAAGFIRASRALALSPQSLAALRHPRRPDDAVEHRPVLPPLLLAARRRCRRAACRPAAASCRPTRFSGPPVASDWLRSCTSMPSRLPKRARCGWLACCSDWLPWASDCSSCCVASSRLRDRVRAMPNCMPWVNTACPLRPFAVGALGREPHGVVARRELLPVVGHVHAEHVPALVGAVTRRWRLDRS